MNRLYTINNTVATAPESETKTGTASTDGLWLIGTASAFLSEINVGDYVVNLATSQVAEVRDVKSDVLVRLNSGFSAELAAAAIVVVPRSNLAQYVIVENNGAGQGSIDGQPLRSGSRKDFGQLNSQGSSLKAVQPMVVDATGTQCDVVVQKS